MSNSPRYSFYEYGIGMKLGDQIDLQIDSLSSKGDGVGVCDGREVHVARSVPGDELKVLLYRKRKGRFEGREVEVLSYAMERQEPICRHFTECGGCRWQHLSYSDQLILKSEMVSRPLTAVGVDPKLIKSIIPARRPTFYRNKMEFSFGTGPEGELRLGLHVRGRYNRVFDLVECHLQSEVSNQIVEAVRRQAVFRHLPVYNLGSHEGLLRFLVVREGKFSDQVLVNLVVAEFPHAELEALAKQVCHELPQITSFVVTRHSGKAQVAKGEEEYVIKGADKISEKCGSLTYEISAQSFFQTNSFQVEVLYDLVADLAEPLENKKILDLYCGTGGIGLHLAKRSLSVYGIEQEEEAVADARKNALANQLTNVEFEAGSVETLLQADQGSFDLTIADPPRVGLHKHVLAALGEIQPPTLIYVSCNPTTLAADLESLIGFGYTVKTVQPVDMFPQTPHCEVVVKLLGSG